MAGAGGFIVMHNALRTLGPTRMTTYLNFTPIVAALAGIVVFGEPVSLYLLIGGGLTLLGVVIVRQNIHLRK